MSETVPKRERMRLARAELIVHLAATCAAWRADLLHEDPKRSKPPEEWGDDDAFVILARTYGLSFADLAKLCDALGDDLERRAHRVGYEDAWDH